MNKCVYHAKKVTQKDDYTWDDHFSSKLYSHSLKLFFNNSKKAFIYFYIFVFLLIFIAIFQYSFLSASDQNILSPSFLTPFLVHFFKALGIVLISASCIYLLLKITLKRFLLIIILAFIFLYFWWTSDVFLLLLIKILNPFTIVENPFNLIYKIILFYPLYKILKYMLKTKA
ncbi:MAG: hypothetical protein COA66_12880 [Arcobacter sp.]|nr:MAG: hypothetical protein COA66_12880 [Arcobacter sp.]